MANLRNNTGAPAAARSGESAQAVRERWAGEVSGPVYGGEMMTGPMGRNDARNGISGSMSNSWDPGVGMTNLPMPRTDWSAGMGQMGMQEMQPGLSMSRNGQSPQTGGLDMSHLVPDEVIESPTTVNEAYLGSLKAMLMQNKGNYIVATFLVGTQNTVSWEGILYEVGNDYVTIYQPGRDRYIVSDMYSLRYMEFYDIRRRELCDRMLQEQGWQNGSW